MHLRGQTTTFQTRLEISEHAADPATLALVCQPEGSEDTLEVPIQGISKAQLMGELAVLQALPIYQLALPFSLEAWRQLEYAHHLTGMTV